MAIERDRDDRGRFASAKQDKRLRDARGRFVKSAAKAADKLSSAYAKQGKQLAKNLKIDKQWAKVIKAQSKTMAKQQKQIQKLTKSPKNLSKTQKSISKGAGFSVALPAFLSAAVIGGAAKAMASYVTQLARARDIASAMAGRRRLDFTSRDAGLFAEFAGQDFVNRFASGVEIAGLTKIRDKLSKALGPDVGKKLTLELTRGFQDSGERAEFLAAASVDVVTALKRFQSVDIGSFSTALAGATMETDALSRTAFTLENAWLQVKQSFETFVKSFVTKNEVDLTTSIQSMAQGVVDIINYGRQLTAEWKPVFSFFTDNLKAMVSLIRSTGKEWQLIGDYAAGVFSGDTRNRIEKQTDEINRIGSKVGLLMAKARRARAAGDEEQAQALMKQAKRLRDEQQKIMAAAKGFFDVQSDVAPITLGIAANIEKITIETGKATDKAKQQRQEFERTRTTAEKVALAMQRIGEATSTENLNLDLIRSQLARHESSPFGFGQAFESRLRGAEQITKLLELNRKKQEQVNKLNLDLRENREKMIRLQIDENNLIGERNRLLKSTVKGYLDAIQAQAFGAGKFEKILITQDKNLGMALVKGIAKANPMLGLSGAAARANDVTPFRFSGNINKDAAGLAKYAASLKVVWQPFIDELRRVLIPPIPKQRIGAAQGKGRSRILTGNKPKSIGATPGDDLIDLGAVIMRGFRQVADGLDAKLAEHDDGLEPGPQDRPGSRGISL